jgi:glycosyltransferase involved in cell wall biosynthesis
MTEQVEDWLTISIATKDRPEVLEATLQRLHSFGLGNCEVLVCDDGSMPPLAPPALGLFPHGRLFRHPVATGQAIARNRIVEAATRPYVLQLDDDSYPVSGSMESLLAAVRERDDWLAMALPLEEPARGRRALMPMRPAMPLRGFVGCAALLNRRAFLATGGYADWIGRMVEEDELSIRGYKQGLEVRGMGNVCIRHDATTAQRNLATIEYLCFRNWTATWLRHAPFPQVVARVLRLAGAAVWLLVRSWQSSAMRGFASGIVDRRSLTGRDPMTRSVYHAYIKLPHALEALSSDA